jgi:hypothetical protein
LQKDLKGKQKRVYKIFIYLKGSSGEVRSLSIIGFELEYFNKKEYADLLNKVMEIN